MEKNHFINDIMSEDDSEDYWSTQDLIEKRKKKKKLPSYVPNLPSVEEILKKPQSYWYGSNLVIRTCPPKKRSKTNPRIKLARFDNIQHKMNFEKDDPKKVVQEKEDNKFNFHQDDDENYQDEWANYIDEIKKKPKVAFLDGIDEENDEKSKVVQDKQDNKSNIH